MKDRNFLTWIYLRLTDKYGENENIDYMSKFRAIIEKTNPEQFTPNAPKASTILEMD